MSFFFIIEDVFHPFASSELNHMHLYYFVDNLESNSETIGQKRQGLTDLHSKKKSTSDTFFGASGCHK